MLHPIASATAGPPPSHAYCLILDARGVKSARSALWNGMDAAPATILLVEDHTATRTFLADNLVADGYEVLEAESTADARRLIDTAFPDAAIVDLGLPDRDGLELVRDVR